MSNYFEQQIPEDPEAKRQKFFREKQAALEWLKDPQHLDSRGESDPMDPNIESFIVKLNENLDFLYTWGSCGGHFYSRQDILNKYPDAPENQLTLPHEGYVTGGGGYITFAVYGSEASQNFIQAINGLISGYPNARLRKISENNYELELIRQLSDDDAFTVEEAEQAKKQISELMVKLQNLVQTYETRGL